MNRETKRMMESQGALDEEGAPVASTTERAPQRAGSGGSSSGRGGSESIPERTVEYAREVRGELQKVAWPGRSEVANYTLVVLVAVVLLTLFVFVVDYGSLKAIIDLFHK